MEQKEKKTKILAVDDDPVIRGLIKSIFLNSKFDVNEADSGEMALEILPDIMPDIILLDIIMSGSPPSRSTPRARKRFPGSCYSKA